MRNKTMLFVSVLILVVNLPFTTAAQTQKAAPESGGYNPITVSYYVDWDDREAYPGQPVEVRVNIQNISDTVLYNAAVTTLFCPEQGEQNSMVCIPDYDGNCHSIEWTQPLGELQPGETKFYTMSVTPAMTATIDSLIRECGGYTSWSNGNADLADFEPLWLHVLPQPIENPIALTFTNPLGSYEPGDVAEVMVYIENISSTAVDSTTVYAWFCADEGLAEYQLTCTGTHCYDSAGGGKYFKIYIGSLFPHETANFQIHVEPTGLAVDGTTVRNCGMTIVVNNHTYPLDIEPILVNVGHVQYQTFLPLIVK